MKKTLTLFIIFTIIISCNLKPFKAVSKVIIKCENTNGSEYDTIQINKILNSKLISFDFNLKIQHLNNKTIEIKFDEEIDFNKIKLIVNQNNKIEFWDTYKNTDIGNSIYEIANDALSNNLFPGYLDSMENIIKNEKETTIYLTDKQVDSLTETSEEDKEMEIFRKTSPLSAYLYPNANKENLWNEGPVLGYAKLSDTAIINDYLSKKCVKDLLKYKDLQFIWESFSSFSSKEGTPLLNLYLVKNTRSGQPELDGKDVLTANQDFDPITRKPIINIQFSKTGSFVWADMTKRSARNYTGIAITFNNKVFSAPIASGEIEGGKTQITGGSFAGVNGVQEAELMAEILNVGKSPYQFKVIGGSKLNQNAK